jgi:uncharacterized protein YdaL
VLVLWATLAASAGAGRTDSVPEPADTLLILHDSGGSFGWMGRLYATMLANLLGHFPLPSRIEPVETYQAGDVDRHRGTFYFGTVFDSPLPAVFLRDVMATSRPVCWFKYNLWQLSGAAASGAEFEAQFGFRFEFLDGSGFTNVAYKGETFSRHPLDPELGRVTVLDPARATAPATAWRDEPARSIPYVIRGANLWYVADVPFSYLSEEDRYLVFADLLHDIVEVPHAESHRAILRLEDVSPIYPAPLLREAADCLRAEGVPFAVAVVPVYADPLGFYNWGVPQVVATSETPEFIHALKYMVGCGGQLVLHGYTHQYGAAPNPHTGATADDYEFCQVTTNAAGHPADYQPVPEDSVAWAQGRVDAALEELRRSGLAAFAWETPHYAASALDYSVFARNFSLTIQRALYTDGAGRYAGQFFPYVIERDVYGQKVLPENLGNIAPAEFPGDPGRAPADLLRIARKNRVVRDGWATAFFHPYLDLADLRALVRGTRALGYTYVPLLDPAPPLITLEPRGLTTNAGAQVTFTAAAAGTEPLRYQWQLGDRDLPGATNASLTLTNARPTDTGAYTLRVTNSVGAAVSFPAVLQVVEMFALTSVVFRNGVCTLTFPSQDGLMYRVEFAEALGEGPWSPLLTVTGDGGMVEVTDPAPARPMRFYRVQGGL